MTVSEFCPKCRKRLPEDAPTGLCPSCLLAAAFALPDPDAGPDRCLSPTTPGATRFVPPSPAALAPMFPHLEILGLLGHGGMGAVYKARQKKLDRLVALKIIRPEAAVDPAFAERFNREARTLARLSHPHIVAVHDFGEVVKDDGTTAGTSIPVFYFLMEFVDGTNLRQLMDGCRLSSNQALAIVPQVCEALQYAHDEGVVHRDIKPENILIDSRGRVKIADFGLAKLVAGSADEFTLTGTHQVMGTPRYMAPEQMEGSHSVDHRADIYSLGVVFYEMLTGQVPGGHFDPPSKKAETDPRLDAIVLRAMARDPERRFQQARHLGSEIDEAKTGNGTSRRSESLTLSEEPASTVSFLALSSFLSHEGRAAYRWVAGSDDPSSKNTSGPRLLMLLLSLVPCAMVFFPWFDVYVTDPNATRGLDWKQTVQFKTGIAFLREFSPLDLPAGMLFGVTVCMLIVSSGMACGRRVSTVNAACTGLVLCSAPLALAMALRSSIEYTLVTVFADPATNAMPNGVRGYANGVGTATLEWIDHKVQFRLPFIAAVGSLFLLLCLLGIELRHAVELSKRKRQSRELKSANTLTAASQLAAKADPMGVAERSPLQKASSVWWAGRHLWLTKAVQSILALGFVFSFVLFISFSTRSSVVYPTPGGRGVRTTLVTFGSPSPWFEFSQNAGGTTGYGFQWKILWLSSSIGIMLLGLLAYWIYWQVEKAKPDNEPSHFGSPKVVFSMVGAVAILCIIMGQLPLLLPEWKQTLTGDSRSPLLIATESGNAAEVQSLLKDGADPNQQLPKGFHSPLWWAVANGDSDIIDALIMAQSDVDFENSVGVTPLMLASARGDISSLGTLISAGARVNAQDRITADAFFVSTRTGEISWPGQRLTPLMLAANNGYGDVAKMLLQAGADASLRNTAGQTAAEMALSRNYRDVHDLILGSLRPALERLPATP